MKSDKRWEIVVISDDDPEVIYNVIRRACDYIAESFAEADHAFDISAFEPLGGESIFGSVYEPGDHDD